MEGSVRKKLVEAQQEAGLMLDDEDDAWAPADFDRAIMSDAEEDEAGDDGESSESSEEEDEGYTRIKKYMGCVAFNHSEMFI